MTSFFIFKTDVNETSKSKQRNLKRRTYFLLAGCQTLRSADPDPYQNVTDPKHCFQAILARTIDNPGNHIKICKMLIYLCAQKYKNAVKETCHIAVFSEKSVSARVFYDFRS